MDSTWKEGFGGDLYRGMSGSYSVDLSAPVAPSSSLCGPIQPSGPLPPLSGPVPPPSFRNSSEMQLYKVLQRANLLTYYETFIDQGGDDIKQLCEAGEEEFMEIMNLVGMSSKPLHIRRLQKTLGEWVTNPAMFQGPITTNAPMGCLGIPHARGSIIALATTKKQAPVSNNNNNNAGTNGPTGNSNGSCLSRFAPGGLSQPTGGLSQPTGSMRIAQPFPPRPISNGFHQPPAAMSALVPLPNVPGLENGGMGSCGGVGVGPSSTAMPPPSQSWSPGDSGGICGGSPGVGPMGMVPGGSGMVPGGSSLSMTAAPDGPWIAGERMSPNAGVEYTGHSLDLFSPSNADIISCFAPVQKNLKENQIESIAKVARILCSTLPHYEPKPLNAKKPLQKEIEETMKMDDSHPERIELLRKFAAIYGRFDSKRKTQKPMSLHEVSVNEAAAQICRHRPELLTRRDELFPLARQVVRDSGFVYTKGPKGNSAAGASSAPSASSAASYSTGAPAELSLRAGRVKIESPPSKRPRLDAVSFDRRQSEIEDRLKAIFSEQLELRTELEAGSIEEEDTRKKVEENIEELSAEQGNLYLEQSEITQANRERACYTEGGVYRNDEDRGSLSSDETGEGHSDLPELRPTPTSHGSVRKNTTDPAGVAVNQESLYDEGLRIAQQYGMADFASELRTMKTTGSGGEEEDEEKARGVGENGDGSVRPQQNGDNGKGRRDYTDVSQEEEDTEQVPEGTVVVKPVGVDEG